MRLIIFFSFLVLVGCSMFDDNFTEISRKGMICSKNYSFSEVNINNIEMGCSGGKCVSSFSISSPGSNGSFRLIYEGDLSKIKNYASVDVSIKNCNFATSVSENWSFLGIIFWSFISPFIILILLGLFSKPKSQ
jgi:hypothetical protein